MANFDVVFEGGGAKGLAFVGALDVLKQNGHTLSRYVGTSAGAISAALCAAGYTVEELMSAVMEKLPDGKPRFSSFMDIPAAADFAPDVRQNSLTMETLRAIDVPFIPGGLEGKFDELLLNELVKDRVYSRLFSFTECGGYYSGRTFLAWIQEKLSAKGIAATDTLQTFHQKTNADLSLVVSDTNDMELLVLNHRTAPGVPVGHAVRMSMSIPFVWQEVHWKAEWGNYMGRTKTGNAVVDGGVLSNFPIRLIATSGDDIKTIMGDADPNASLNLGLMLDEQLSVSGAPNTAQTPLPATHLKTIHRLSRLIDTMMRASDNDAVRRFESEICRLPTKGYGTLEFDLSGPRLDVFLQAARSAMLSHLQSRGLDAKTMTA